MKKYFLFLLFIIYCNPDGDDNDFETTPYSLNYPTDVFPQMIIPEDNLLTQEGVSLGKKLFFDPILSVNNTISCAYSYYKKIHFLIQIKTVLGLMEILDLEMHFL